MTPKTIRRTDYARGLAYQWLGSGHTVNVYDLDGRSVDCFTVGDQAQNDATPEEIRKAIANRISGA